MRLMLSREPERREKTSLRHDDILDALLHGVFRGSVGHIEITGKRKTVRPMRRS